MKNNKIETNSESTVEEKEIPVYERDEFADPQYIDQNAKLPRIQALRGTSSEMCGYFVPVDQMAIAGWKNFDESQLITYTFESNGTQDQGILVAHPRMLVCPKTPVLAYDKDLTKETTSPVILGHYTPECKKDDNIGNIQYFHVFLLDQQNQPLHQTPLSYKATGTNQATFSNHWQKFCQELNACHAIVNRQAAKKKDDRFYSLGVFCFKCARELVGDKQKSFACRVVEHERPTLENWRTTYFVGFSAIKKYIWDSLEPTKPLMIPGNPELPVLPVNINNPAEDNVSIVI